jgi:hypothetical protein
VRWLAASAWIAAATLAGCATILKLHSNGPLDGRPFFALAGFFFACMGFVTVRALLRNAPLLTSSQQGIEDGQLGFALLPWQEVIAAEVNVQIIREFPYTTLYLKLENQEEYFGRVSFLNRLSIPVHSWHKKLVPLDFTRLDGSVDEAVESMETFRPGLPIEYRP